MIKKVSTTYCFAHRIDHGNDSEENFLELDVLQTCPGCCCMLALRSYCPEFFLWAKLLKVSSLVFPGGSQGTKSGVPIMTDFFFLGDIVCGLIVSTTLYDA